VRITAITPMRVTAAELSRRQARYDRLAPPPLRVRLLNLDDPAAPAALETAADIRRSEELVAAAIERLDPATCDAVLPDCVLDPAVTRDGPVFGILRLTAGFLTGCGLRFGAVTRNAAIGAELADRLRAYGLDGLFAGNRVLGLDAAAIADDARWHAAVGRAAAGLDARVVINGCSAVDVAPGRVIDPTALALRLIALAP
jgi:Asp/Glu/hydantoin racemase